MSNPLANVDGDLCDHDFEGRCRRRVVALSGLLLLVLLGCQGERYEAGSSKFSTFSQKITSNTAVLALSSNERIVLPVKIENTGSDTWFQSGIHPVNVSYKWVKQDQILPIEGVRTHIPKPVMKPGDKADVQVSVVSPSIPGNYELQVTLVQEGVAWFNLSGAAPLKIACTVR